MIILGLNAYHADASACILMDGKIRFAIEEERIRRKKHWAGLPTESIKACLVFANLEITDVDVIAVSRDPKAKLFKKIRFASSKIFSMKTLKSRGENSLKINSIKSDILDAFDRKEAKAKVVFIEHHRCHLASSFYTSPFEKSALLSIDGFGDFTSTMWGTGEHSKIKVLDSISFPHSIGIFYTAMTQFLGFNHFGDEYKMMGLAAYGQAKYLEQLRDIVSIQKNGTFKLNGDYFRLFNEGVELSWEDGSPREGYHFTEKTNALFPDFPKNQKEITPYHKDLAKSAQTLLEEVIFKLAQHLFEETKMENLCISGGVAQNSVANGKLLNKTGFKNLYVPPAGHDAGNCIGAALYFYHHLSGNTYQGQNNFHACLGPSFENDFIMQEVDRHGLKGSLLSFEKIYEIVINCLTIGGIVGWVQGRTEFGPRALGNRSILADPRRSDVREILNEKIKQRELFRPFAASILEEHSKEYFDSSQHAPFMERVFQVKEKHRRSIPSVTHADGSCRIQTVNAQTNPIYYDLIKAFYKKTTIPMLINTSFNQQEPIVNTPQDALLCFTKTQMDMLVLGNVLITKQ